MWIPLRNTRKALNLLQTGVIFTENELKDIFSLDEFTSLYQYPDTSSVNAPRYVGNSLCYHSRLAQRAARQTVPPTESEMMAILNDVEHAFRHSKVLWHRFEEIDDELMADFVSQTDRHATPGYPWKEEAPTNGDLFGLDELHVPRNFVNVQRVKHAANVRLASLRNGTPDSDDINVFIKQEPHKMKKVEAGAWRLIQGIGLTDTIIDRFLFGHWFSALIEQHRRVPSKPGWAPVKGGFSWLAKQFRVPMMADKSGWDWTVQAWHVDFLKKFIPRMIVGIPEVTVNARLDALFSEATWRIGDSRLHQVAPGIMKSGCLGTIAFNSIWQFAAHALACRRIGWNVRELGNFACLGDDTLQECVPDVPRYEEEIAKTGAIVKQSEVDRSASPRCEFGGFLFDTGRCEPVYRAKHAYALYHCSEDRANEMVGSYLVNYGMVRDVSSHLRVKLLQRGCPENALSDGALHSFWTGYE